MLSILTITFAGVVLKTFKTLKLSVLTVCSSNCSISSSVVIRATLVISSTNGLGLISEFPGDKELVFLLIKLDDDGRESLKAIASSIRDSLGKCDDPRL